MRKLVYGINITLDGCCDHTKGIANEEVHEYFTGLLSNADTLVYGRKTYDLMIPFWPDVAKERSGANQAMNDFAETFNAIGEIILFSRSLEKVENGKTRIVNGDLSEEIRKLKNQPGRDISLGGVDLPSQLMELDLIDEYHFVVHPVIAGEGRRLLEGVDLPKQLQLKLKESKVFKSGHVALRYVKGTEI